MRATRRKTRDKYILKNIPRTFAFIVILGIIIWVILFVHVEWRSIVDSLYFIIMTITTIGYGDIVPITQIGKIIAIVFAISGVPIFIWIVGLIFEERFKKSINKHMHVLEKELVETEEKLEETESKLLTEEKKLVKLWKQQIQEVQKKKVNFFKKVFHS